jgi:hypothetical protein
VTWVPVTTEQQQLFRQIMLWIRTVREAGVRYGNPFYGPDWLPSDADFNKSALLERIRSGLQPMDEPPPVGFACPWYALVEDAGPHYIFEVWFKDNCAIINQNPFTLYEKLGEKEYIVGDARGTSYRFRLWFDPDWRHPSEKAAQLARFQGGWFMQNTAFASGILTEGGEAKQAPGDSLSSPVGEAETPSPNTDPGPPGVRS